MNVAFDPTINLGHVLSLITMCGGLIAAYISLRMRITRVETMISPIWRWWNGIAGEQRPKSDEEIEHDIRGLEQIKISRAEVRRRRARESTT